MERLDYIAKARERIFERLEASSIAACFRKVPGQSDSQGDRWVGRLWGGLYDLDARVSLSHPVISCLNALSSGGLDPPPRQVIESLVAAMPIAPKPVSSESGASAGAPCEPVTPRARGSEASMTSSKLVEKPEKGLKLVSAIRRKVQVLEGRDDSERSSLPKVSPGGEGISSLPRTGVETKRPDVGPRANAEIGSPKALTPRKSLIPDDLVHTPSSSGEQKGSSKPQTSLVSISDVQESSIVANVVSGVESHGISSEQASEPLSDDRFEAVDAVPSEGTVLSDPPEASPRSLPGSDPIPPEERVKSPKRGEGIQLETNIYSIRSPSGDGEESLAPPEDVPFTRLPETSLDPELARPAQVSSLDGKSTRGNSPLPENSRGERSPLEGSVRSCPFPNSPKSSFLGVHLVVARIFSQASHDSGAKEGAQDPTSPNGVVAKTGGLSVIPLRAGVHLGLSGELVFLDRSLADGPVRSSHSPKAVPQPDQDRPISLEDFDVSPDSSDAHRVMGITEFIWNRRWDTGSFDYETWGYKALGWVRRMYNDGLPYAFKSVSDRSFSPDVFNRIVCYSVWLWSSELCDRTDGLGAIPECKLVNCIRDVARGYKFRANLTSEQKASWVVWLSDFSFPTAPSSFLASYRNYLYPTNTALRGAWFRNTSHLKQKALDAVEVLIDGPEQGKAPPVSAEVTPTKGARKSGPEKKKGSGSVGKKPAEAKGGPRPKRPMVAEEAPDIVDLSEDQSDAPLLPAVSRPMKREKKEVAKVEAKKESPPAPAAAVKVAVLGADRIPKEETPLPKVAASLVPTLSVLQGSPPGRTLSESSGRSQSDSPLSRGLFLSKDRRAQVNRGNRGNSGSAQTHEQNLECPSCPTGASPPNRLVRATRRETSDGSSSTSPWMPREQSGVFGEFVAESLVAGDCFTVGLFPDIDHRGTQLDKRGGLDYTCPPDAESVWIRKHPLETSSITCAGCGSYIR